MSNQEVPQTQSTKSGSSETSSKTRLKKKGYKEVEAEVTEEGKVLAEVGGETKEYVIDSPEDFRWALGECQMAGVQNLEVSDRLFTMLSQGKDTPCIIYGSPAVKIFRFGTMDRNLKILSLSVEKLSELKAKKAREEAAAKKKAEDEITSL